MEQSRFWHYAEIPPAGMPGSASILIEMGHDNRFHEGFAAAWLTDKGSDLRARHPLNKYDNPTEETLMLDKDFFDGAKPVLEEAGIPDPPDLFPPLPKETADFPCLELWANSEGNFPGNRQGSSIWSNLAGTKFETIVLEDGDMASWGGAGEILCSRLHLTDVSGETDFADFPQLVRTNNDLWLYSTDLFLWLCDGIERLDGDFIKYLERAQTDEIHINIHKGGLRSVSAEVMDFLFRNFKKCRLTLTACVGPGFLEESYPVVLERLQKNQMRIFRSDYQKLSPSWHPLKNPAPWDHKNLELQLLCDVPPFRKNRLFGERHMPVFWDTARGERKHSLEW